MSLPSLEPSDSLWFKEMQTRFLTVAQREQVVTAGHCANLIPPKPAVCNSFKLISVLYPYFQGC